MKQFLCTIFVLAFSVVGHFPEAVAQPAARKAQRYRVGVIIPLSGPAADYGRSIQNSLRMAAEDSPDFYSKVEFIYEDAEHHVPKAVSAFQKLRTHNKVDLIYTFGVSFCKALAPLAELYKTPVVGQCIDAASSRDKRYFIRFMNNTDEYLHVQTDHLASEGKQKIGVVLSEHPYLEEMYAALKRNLQPGQQVEIIDRFNTITMDFRTTIARIRRSEIHAVGIFLYPGQISAFYRQARDLQFTTPTFGTNFFESLSTVADARGAMNGATFVANSARSAFIERYRARHNQATQVGFGSLAYEFGSLLGRLLENRKEKLDAEALLALLDEVPPYPGTVAGPYHYERSPEFGSQFTFPLTVKVIMDDQIMPLSKLTHSAHTPQ